MSSDKSFIEFIVDHMRMPKTGKVTDIFPNSRISLS